MLNHRKVLVRAAALASGLALLASAAFAETKGAYQALGLEPTEVLAGTILNSKVVPGAAKQVVCVATYFTGKHGKADAVNVRLGVFDVVGSKLVPRYTRDFGAERGGYVANGDLQVLDLDRDGVNEIIVSFDNYSDPLISERLAEVLVVEKNAFRTAWAGPLEYDATRAARSLPQERRDRFVRELNLRDTLRTRGITLFFDKKMIAVAGERLPEPRVVQETFPLRSPPPSLLE